MIFIVDFIRDKPKDNLRPVNTDDRTESIQAPGSHTHFSKAAVASGVLGVIGLATLWLVFGLFLAAIGAVCGHMAHFHIRSSGKKLRGRALATFGLGASYLAMLIFPILLGAVSASVPFISKYKETRIARLEERSLSSASRLFVACESYSRANNGEYPNKWDSLSGKYIPANELRQLLTSVYPAIRGVDFELVPHERPVLNSISNSVMVIQQIAPPIVKKVAVVYADGNVALILNPNRP